MEEHWSVSVNIGANNILNIGENYLSGWDDVMDYADTVQGCAEHLLSFIGRETETTTELRAEVLRLTALCDGYRGEVEALKRSNEEYAQKTCDECDPENYGWVFNRAEGRGACTCMIEAEPFQILLAALETISKAATGEIQIADDDTGGMRWIAGKAMEALHSVLPLDYEAPRDTAKGTASFQSALTRARAEGMEEGLATAERILSSRMYDNAIVAKEVDRLFISVRAAKEACRLAEQANKEEKV